ncbi:hypothetical protein [Desertivirga arenae]|uniref:hypothetical protein n=1 Tax=Desertivirga arenae TaxID=2810309 RepID=UPI001A96C237|nr:hypothetical protein [Pedobacter sp. SYSU D00823]
MRQTTDPYQSFKRGITSDLISAAINLTGGFGVFLLIWILLVGVWALISEKSGLSDSARLMVLGFLAVIIPCLFFRRTANFIVKLWGLLLLLVIGGLVIFVFGWFTFMMLKQAF